MAVFKVISVPQKYADEDAYADLIHYCIRPMKTPGNFIDGFGVLPQLAAEQMQIVSHAYRQDHGIRLRHWIISFEKDEIRDAWHANQFAQQVCWFYAERYQILYSVHEDAQNIHSVNEFSTRTTENIRKGYLVGKYGATPGIEIEEVE